MIGLNLQTGMQYAICKNFLISPTLLELLFIMQNNGRNGTWLLHLKSNPYQESGTKNVTVLESWS